MPTNRNDVEIRAQAHLMDAEGLGEGEPTEAEIVALLENEGWIASNIDIWFDAVMKLWAWTADIDRVNK